MPLFGMVMLLVSVPASHDIDGIVIVTTLLDRDDLKQGAT